LNGNVTAWIGHERHASVRGAIALGVLLAWLGPGCSESSSTLAGGGASDDAPSHADVASTPDASPTSDVSSTPDAGAADTTLADVAPMDDHPADAAPTADSDVGCECSIGDAGNIPTTGILSIPYYCVKQDWHDDFGQRPTCPTYDDAVACTDAARSFTITTYKNCNFVTVDYDVSNAVDMRVYDATSHELVGAMRGTDFVVASCGSIRGVNVIQSGVVPGPECEVARRLRPCDQRDAGDGATDGGPADSATDDAGACTCTLNDGAPPEGRVSLACYCGNLGLCPDYRESLDTCAAPPDTFHTFSLEEYAGCNISIVHLGWPPSAFANYFYDFTTHELVGLTSSTRDSYACGDGRTPTFRAGLTAIDPSCVRTKYVERCPDRGDAATED
jgi:hypothetical protein